MWHWFVIVFSVGHQNKRVVYPRWRRLTGSWTDPEFWSRLWRNVEVDSQPVCVSMMGIFGVHPSSFGPYRDRILHWEGTETVEVVLCLKFLFLYTSQDPTCTRHLPHEYVLSSRNCFKYYTDRFTFYHNFLHENLHNSCQSLSMRLSTRLTFFFFVNYWIPFFLLIHFERYILGLKEFLLIISPFNYI